MRFSQCWASFASWEIITVYCTVPASAQKEPSGSTSPTGVFPCLSGLFSLHWKLAAWLLLSFVGFFTGGSTGWTETTVILKICFGWGQKSLPHVIFLTHCFCWLANPQKCFLTVLFENFPPKLCITSLPRPLSTWQTWVGTSWALPSQAELRQDKPTKN